VSVRARATPAIEPQDRPAPAPRAGWTQIPRPFLDAAPLDNDRLAHVLLISYAWDEDTCHPYQGDLAAELGCSTRTVKRRTADLRRAALITVKRGGRGHANIYHFAAAPARDDDTGYATVPNAVLGDADLSQGAKRAYVMVAHHSNTQGRCIRTVARIAGYVGGCYKSAYNYLRELEEAGYVRSTPQGRGLPNVYDVGTPQMRRRAARKGAAPVMTVLNRADLAAEDRHWRAVYRELMGTEPADRLHKQLHSLAVDPAVGEDLLIEALRGADEWARGGHNRRITINAVRVELDKIARERPVEEEPPPPVDYFGGKYGHLIECAGCGRRKANCTCGGRDGPVVTDAPTATGPPIVPRPTVPVSGTAPAPIERCGHCLFAPCRCPRKERRARERVSRTKTKETGNKTCNRF
jgi:hypothetical protein